MKGRLGGPRAHSDGGDDGEEQSESEDENDSGNAWVSRRSPKCPDTICETFPLPCWPRFSCACVVCPCARVRWRWDLCVLGRTWWGVGAALPGRFLYLQVAGRWSVMNRQGCFRCVGGGGEPARKRGEGDGENGAEKGEE